ncbi:hypothetical protein [Agaribacter flavus]
MQRGNSVTHGFNRYAYVNNNPYKYTDPDGEFFNVALGGFGAVVGAIGGGISAALAGEDIVQGALIGGGTGALAGLTMGTSLVATVATGAVVAAGSDIASQTIDNFDADSVDMSSVGDALESGASELVDAVSDVNLEQTGMKTLIGAATGGLSKLSSTMKIDEQATTVIAEGANITGGLMCQDACK